MIFLFLHFDITIVFVKVDITIVLVKVDMTIVFVKVDITIVFVNDISCVMRSISVWRDSEYMARVIECSYLQHL